MSNAITDILAKVASAVLPQAAPVAAAAPAGAAASAPAAGAAATQAPALSAPQEPMNGATPGSAQNLVHVRLLGINDFHGQIGDSDAKVDNQAIGGAATLAAYIARERAGNPNGTVLVSAGDAFGASPPESSLLHHESSMATLAGMGVQIATPGNHEFDAGFAEFARLVFGGRRRKRGKNGKLAPVGAKWPGSPFPWVSANIVDKKTRKPVFPPYAIMDVNGVKVAFVGAVTKSLKTVTVASGIKNIEAIDPAEAVNSYIPELQAKGVKAIVMVVHEGGNKSDKPGEVTGPVADIAKRLDPEVDVIMSAHSHQEYATRIAGKLVVQGGSYAKALAAVDLSVDPKTGQVVSGGARIVRNLEQGIDPDPTVGELAQMFKQAVAGKTEQVVSVLPGDVTREKSPAGETALGNLVAEAQRYYAGADIGMMNPGGLRQDAAGGPITWGKLFGVQPFANGVTRLEMTGAQIRAVLEQQFQEGKTTVLQLAGLRIVMDPRKPQGQRIVKMTTDDGRAVDPKKTYVVAANSFIAEGGDGFPAFKQVKKRKGVGVDLQALVAYLSAGMPVPLKPMGRTKLAPGSELPGGHKH